jgi:hypothetical protein
MRFNNTFTHGSPHTLKLLYDSALTRYKRNDPAGAADTLRNMAQNLNPSVNFYKLEPLEGTIEDAIAAFSDNKPKRTLKILKHLQLQMHYGRLAV